MTVSVGDPVLIQQDFTCVNGLFNGVMDLSSAGLAEGPIAVNATQISLTAGALVEVLVDTIIPIAPTIVTPVDGSSTTNQNLSVTGACETGATVNVFGDFTGSPLTAPCVSSSYVRSISLILGNGVKSISATQTDSVGNTSPATAITINLGIPPSAPTITSPTAGLLTNQTAQTITGTCETGATVNISGDVVGAPVTTACVASAYSQAITLTASNGVKSIDVSQTNTAGTSPTVNRTVNLDTVNPAAPGISTPVNGAQTNLVAQTVAGTLSGSCEAGATVNISGDIVGSPLTTSCVSTTYSRAVTLVIGDGVKNISATQTDAAGNTSVATNISITLDQTLPIAPTIASPANGLITNTQNQTISGTCETAATVSISGGIIGAPVTTVCAAGSYSTAITLTAADGAKALNVTQRDVALNLSPAASISVTLDRTLPSAPTIVSPANNSYTNQTAQTVRGACESGATVNLSGDFTGSPLTTVCAASAYSRAITLTAGDGTKSISATQTDVAGNTSTPTNISITLDTVNPAAPVITTPANNSFTNATSVIASSGGFIQVAPTQSGSFSGSVTNSAGTTICSTPNIIVNPPVPSCTLVTNQTSITSGQSATLTLTPSGVVNSAKINGQTISASGGSIQVTPTQSGTYSGTVTNISGTATCSTAQITVNPPIVNGPTCTLSANPTTINPGQNVTLTLTPMGTITSAKINGQTIATSGGSVQVSPTQSGAYSGTVINLAGSYNCSSPQITVSIIPPTCTLAVNKATNNIPGDKVNFTLNISGTATSAKIDNINVNLQNPVLNSVDILANKTFSAIVTNSGGSNSCSIAVSTKPQVQWTRLEYFTAKIGPMFQGAGLPQSINDYAMNRCHQCHSLPAKIGYELAPTFMIISMNDSAANFSAMSSVYVPAKNKYLNLTTPPVNTESLWSFAKGHKPKTPPFTTQELQHMIDFINF